MIKLLNKVEDFTYVAVSGGINSSVAATFLAMKKNIHLLHYLDPKASDSDMKADACSDLADSLGVKMDVFVGDEYTGLNKALYINQKVTRFLLKYNKQVVTGHSLEKAIDIWLSGAIHGAYALPSYRYMNITKSFMINEYKDVLDFAKKSDVKYIEKPPEKIEPYLLKTFRQKILNKYDFSLRKTA